ncbi:ABC transporter ATP-binding protein [Solemya velesiana gill symbiont]|uniref:Macrolide ABC transporter ATP-binding protein n=1 Tax=Solemya velesiana gill symbiont TaxID=1918948 RepID=A0A1T2KS98_9GAMM|nr:ABC transporter ATP-binding protein [Solemya velesiana gill symbiont]OOZ35671.1 macrolide ABC transporter ATP-binding protein [Solemya velesiana gill symbiont]
MIRLDGINRAFKVGSETVHALRDVNLEAEAGAYLSIMGPSGSGKSTLLNILGLLDRPDSGNYLLESTDTTTLSEVQRTIARRERIGFVFQAFHLVPRLTAAQNVELPMTLAGIEPEHRKVRVAEALENLGLSDRADHRPDQLSGGERQRVAIARATIMRPAILLADEPTGNLDKASSEDVIKTLESLNQTGITLLVVTHDPEIGERARRRIHMVDGAIVVDHSR